MDDATAASSLSAWVWAILGFVILGALVNLKKSRSDGTLLAPHKLRTMMAYIMRTRNESVVYFDSYAKVDELTSYIEEARKNFHLDITHCAVAAVFYALLEAPKMNRFVSGRNMYQRKGRHISFSMKRNKGDQDAKLATVKVDQPDGQTFKQLCEAVNEKIGFERTDIVTYTDKEVSLFLKMPRPLLDLCFGLFKWLDFHNLLPASFIANDAMFTSVFIANLGSVNMAPGYHHLYEWGNCPLFMMVGKLEERPMVVDGEVVIQKVVPIRYSYDERIDDGLSARFGIDAANRVLENPYYYLGCLKEDGSDHHDLSRIRVPPKPATTETSVGHLDDIARRAREQDGASGAG